MSSTQGLFTLYVDNLTETATCIKSLEVSSINGFPYVSLSHLKAPEHDEEGGWSRKQVFLTIYQWKTLQEKAEIINRKLKTAGALEANGFQLYTAELLGGTQTSQKRLQFVSMGSNYFVGITEFFRPQCWIDFLPTKRSVLLTPNEWQTLQQKMAMVDKFLIERHFMQGLTSFFNY